MVIPRSKSARWTLAMAAVVRSDQAAIGTGVSSASIPRPRSPVLASAAFFHSLSRRSGLAPTISRPLAEAAAMGVGGPTGEWRPGARQLG